MYTYRYLILTLVLLVITGIVSAQVIAYMTAQTYVTQQLERVSGVGQQISRGIRAMSGKWDITKYVSDPSTPHPRGSSGYTDPLYIVTVDGLVIERNAPIQGLLDATDYSHIVEHATPQIVRTITDESWMMQSRVIAYKGSDLAAIAVGIYQPERFQPDALSTKMTSTLNYLADHVVVRDGVVDVSDIDIRLIDYDVSFEIVTRYNKSLLNNGRLPIYIDKSIVFDQMSTPSLHQVIETDRGVYALARTPILTSTGARAGLIITGAEVGAYSQSTRAGWWYYAIVLSITNILLCGAVYMIQRSYARAGATQVPTVTDISFDSHRGLLKMDSHTVTISHGTYQFHLCEALFRDKHTKHLVKDICMDLEIDVIDAKAARKVYDAMIAINKKCEPYLHTKLITYDDLGYSLNPIFRSDAQSVDET